MSEISPHFSCLTLTTFSGQLRRGDCLLSESTVRLVTVEGSVYNFLNFYAQVFFQNDFMVKLHAQGNPVPLKQCRFTLILYHYAASFINIRRMRKCKKSFHYFEIAALCGDDTKMLLETYILQGCA